MNRKTLVAVLAGVLIAALLCIIAGLIIYIPAANVKLDDTAADYASLLQVKNSRMSVGSLILTVGLSCFILPSVVLIVMMIIYIVTAIKNREK